MTSQGERRLGSSRPVPGIIWHTSMGSSSTNQRKFGVIPSALFPVSYPGEKPWLLGIGDGKASRLLPCVSISNPDWDSGPEVPHSSQSAIAAFAWTHAISKVANFQLRHVFFDFMQPKYAAKIGMQISRLTFFNRHDFFSATSESMPHLVDMCWLLVHRLINSTYQHIEVICPNESLGEGMNDC